MLPCRHTGALNNFSQHIFRSTLRSIEKCFLVLEPSKIIFLYRKLYSKRRISSYSVLVTIMSPNKIRRKWGPGVDLKRLCVGAHNLGVHLQKGCK